MHVTAWQVLLSKPCKLPNVNVLLVTHEVIAESVRASELSIKLSEPQNLHLKNKEYV